MEKISRGQTFKGSISTIGSVMFVIGLVITISKWTQRFSFVNCALGILMTMIGAILFLSIRGVLIDTQKNLIKPYFDLIMVKIGTWESLALYDKIVLRYFNESQTMSSRGSSTTYETKSFDIVLTSNRKKDLIIKEFANYDEAKLFLEEYSLRLAKENIDTYKIIKERILERKQQIRR